MSRTRAARKRTPKTRRHGRDALRRAAQENVAAHDREEKDPRVRPARASPCTWAIQPAEFVTLGHPARTSTSTAGAWPTPHCATRKTPRRARPRAPAFCARLSHRRALLLALRAPWLPPLLPRTRASPPPRIPRRTSSRRGAPSLTLHHEAQQLAQHGPARTGWWTDSGANRNKDSMETTPTDAQAGVISCAYSGRTCTQLLAIVTNRSWSRTSTSFQAVP